MSVSFFLGDRNRTLDEQLSKFESYLMRAKVLFTTVLGKVYLNIFRYYFLTTNHARVSQFEDHIFVQTVLALLHRGVCVYTGGVWGRGECGGMAEGEGEFCVSYVRCRRLPYVDKIACYVTFVLV